MDVNQLIVTLPEHGNGFSVNLRQRLLSGLLSAALDHAELNVAKQESHRNLIVWKCATSERSERHSLKYSSSAHCSTRSSAMNKSESRKQ